MDEKVHSSTQTDDREEGCGNVCLSFLSIQQNEATGIPVTIYSILELSERVIVLGQTFRL